MEKAGLVFSRGCARSADFRELQGVPAGIESDVVRQYKCGAGRSFSNRQHSFAGVLRG